MAKIRTTPSSSSTRANGVVVRDRADQLHLAFLTNTDARLWRIELAAADALPSLDPNVHAAAFGLRNSVMRLTAPTPTTEAMTSGPRSRCLLTDVSIQMMGSKSGTTSTHCGATCQAIAAGGCVEAQGHRSNDNCLVNALIRRRRAAPQRSDRSCQQARTDAR